MNRLFKASNFTQNPEQTRQVNDLLKMKRQIRVNGGQTLLLVTILKIMVIFQWIVVKVLFFWNCE